MNPTSASASPRPRPDADRPVGPVVRPGAATTGSTSTAEPNRHPGRRPQHHRVVRLVVAAVTVVAVVVHGVADAPLLVDGTYLGVLVAASVGAWWGAARAPRGDRLVPCLVAGGVAVSALGDVGFETLTGAGVHADPSVADVAWVASYGFLVAALWSVLRRTRTPGRSVVEPLIDVATIVVVGVSLLWGSSVADVLSDPERTPFARAVQAFYPVADAVLLALVVRLLLSHRGRRGIGPWFAAGVVLWFVADLAYLVSPSERWATASTDGSWMAAAVLMAAACWSSRYDTAAPLPQADPAASAPQLVLAVSPLLVPPLLEVVADLRGEADRPGRLLVTMTLLVALAFVRTRRLVHSERAALEELQQARDQALAASEAKSVFLANMGHEIRTPLTTVLAAAELLEDTPLDPAQQQLLERMQRCGALLRDLVERVLDFSRLAGGEVRLEPTVFDPAALVEDLVDAHGERARTQGLDLTSYVDPAAPAEVTADLVRVFQVLSNLLDNALKFTADGSVRIEVRPGGDEVRFLVIDTGIGIHADEQDRVFDLFHQLDESETRAYGGSGLGLAICRQLALAMGGQVAVVSTPGDGSCFELRLPARPEPPGPPVSPA